MFATAALIGRFQHRLSVLLGSGDTAASQYDAAMRLALISRGARGARRRRRGLPATCAGARAAGPGSGRGSCSPVPLPGAGRPAQDRAGPARRAQPEPPREPAFSAGDSIYLQVVRDGDIRSSLIVLFVGGIGAMIAVGRTLSRPVAPDYGE